MNIEPTHEISDKVHHICSDEHIGIVVDWRYIRSKEYFEYLVTFGHTDPRMWLSENELKPVKNEIID